MVHALEQIEAILKPGGTLLDIRPMAPQWPVEVFIAGEPRLAGHIDDMGKLEDDLAANRAMELVVARDLFEQTAAGEFEFEYYWNTPHQMVEFIEQSWGEDSWPSPEIAGEAERLSQEPSFDKLVRIRRKVILGTYRTRT